MLQQAYLAISLDATGLLRFLAFWVANRGGPSGRRLYVLLYLFFLSAGILIGNVSLLICSMFSLTKKSFFLSRTPLFYLGLHFWFTSPKFRGKPFCSAGMIADLALPRKYHTTYSLDFCSVLGSKYRFGIFVKGLVHHRLLYSLILVLIAASAVLVSSNPTNLVLSEVFSLSFASYTANLILPVLAAAAVSLPVVLYQFRNPAYIPSTIPSVTIDTKSILIDRPGAIIGSILTLCTLVTLVGTSPLKIPVWEVTVPPALIMLSRDILHDLKTAHYVRQSNANPTQGDFEIDNTEISPAGYHHRPPPSWVEHPLKWLSLIRQRFPIEYVHLKENT